MALYSKIDHEVHGLALDRLDATITRAQLAGLMNGLEAQEFHRLVQNIRTLTDKRLARTRFILSRGTPQKSLTAQNRWEYNPRRGR